MNDTLATLVPFLGQQAIGFAVFIVYASFFEWTLHKYLMHKPLLGFTYSFKAHAIVHHREFKHDSTYHITTQDPELIKFAWWNAPVLVALNAPIIYLLQHVTGLQIFSGACIAMMCYYAAYESLHWCMHYPRDRFFERWGIYKWIDLHHRYHHYKHFRNLNVVLPLADFCLGTLVVPDASMFARYTPGHEHEPAREPASPEQSITSAMEAVGAGSAQ